MDASFVELDQRLVQLRDAALPRVQRHLPPAQIAQPLTGRQFLALVFEEAGHRPNVAVASRPMIRMAGLFNPFLRELNETLYQFEQPFVSDASKFQRAFGPFEPTPHPEAVRLTVDWFRLGDP